MRPLELDALATALATRHRRVLDMGGSKPRNAAVLVPLVNVDGDLHVLFTLRTDSVPTHKGQVAFPGGGVAPEDPDVVATALREAHEEIGLAPERVDVLGTGDDAFSMNALRVTPVAGYVHQPPVWVPDPREIADIFTVPLRQLQDPDAMYEESMTSRHGNSMRVPFFRHGKHTIWGLTAWMLRELLTVMDGIPRGEAPPLP